MGVGAHPALPSFPPSFYLSCPVTCLRLHAHCLPSPRPLPHPHPHPDPNPVALTKQAGEAGGPKLAVLLVGDRPDSKKYVQHKIKACKDAGVDSVTVTVDPTGLPGTDLTSALIHKVRQLNDDPGVHGIIVQLPLPLDVDTKRVLAEIRHVCVCVCRCVCVWPSKALPHSYSPHGSWLCPPLHPLLTSTRKDVDGFGAEHMGALAGGVLKAGASSSKPLVPCTAAGILELLDQYDIPVRGKQVVIVGRSPIVGMPSQVGLPLGGCAN